MLQIQTLLFTLICWNLETRLVILNLFQDLNIANTIKTWCWHISIDSETSPEWHYWSFIFKILSFGTSKFLRQQLAIKCRWYCKNKRITWKIMFNLLLDLLFPRFRQNFENSYLGDLSQFKSFWKDDVFICGEYFCSKILSIEPNLRVNLVLPKICRSNYFTDQKFGKIAFS